MLKVKEENGVRRRFTLDSDLVVRRNKGSSVKMSRVCGREASGKKKVARLVNNPILLQLYPILIKQQKRDLKEHFETFRTVNLTKDKDNAALLVELFNYSNQVEEAIEREIEVIVTNKFSLQTTKANYRETTKSTVKTLTQIQKHTSFEELLKSGYNRYKQDFLDNEFESRCKTSRKEEKAYKTRQKRLSSRRSLEEDEDDNDCISIENNMKEKRYKSFIGLNQFAKLNSKAEKNTASTLRSNGRDFNEYEDNKNNMVKLVKRLDFGHIKRRSRIIKLN